MKILKFLLIAVLLVALGVVAFAALFWQQLLSPEQKINFGYFEAAATDFQQAAQRNPADPAALAAYVDSLTTLGNLGRATCLSELYNVDSPRLAGLREVVGRSLQAEADRRAYDFSSDPAVIAEAGMPVREALRYLEGYQHALLGDWASARNYFGAVDTKLLARSLKPYHQYYLARSYRLAGDEVQRSQVVDLFSGLFSGQPDRELVAKARYNLVAWYLSEDFEGDRVIEATRQFNQITVEDSVWALQKAHLEFADYFSAGSDPARAFEHASHALLAGPETVLGNTAAKQCLEILEQSPPQTVASLKLPQGFPVALATTAVRFDYPAAAVRALLMLKSVQNPDNDRFGETCTGLSECYLETENASAMIELVSAPAFRSIAAKNRAQVLFNHGLLLKRNEKWSSAIAAFEKSAACSTELGGEALYQAYSVLKRVQAKIDQQRATRFLNRIITDYPDSEAYLKAVEELLPLLIHTGQSMAAGQLCSEVAAHATVSVDPGRQRTHQQAVQVASYWLAYLAGNRGDTSRIDYLEAKIGLRYWNYFELTSNYPPQPQLADRPAIVAQPEHAGEYFCGLGLTDTARGVYEGLGIADDNLLIYLDLRNREYTQQIPDRQWYATEVLEQGGITEQALLNFVLAEAYPRPFADEVSRAAAEFDVSEALIYAIMKKETNFKPDSVSWVGAEGLMQLMPATAQWLNGRYNLNVNLNNVKDPAVNIRLGAAYIRSLLNDYGENNIRAVIHIYNGGPGNYKTWRENYLADPVLFTDVVPNEQNETYAKKVIKYFKVYDWLLSRD